MNRKAFIWRYLIVEKEFMCIDTPRVHLHWMIS